MISVADVIISQPDAIEWAALIILTAAFCLSIKMALARINRLAKYRRLSILALNFVAFSAIACLVFKPQLKSSDVKKVRLVTTGVSKGVVTKVKSTNVPNFFFLPEAFPGKSGESEIGGNELISDPQQLLLRHPDVTEIEVLGDGLTESQWASFDKVKIEYTSPELVVGLTEVSWKKVINLGNYFHVSGKLQVAKETILDRKPDNEIEDNTSVKNIYIVSLIDPAGDKVAETSVLGNDVFQLSTQPKMVGQHQYVIQVKNSEKTILLEEKVSLSVTNIVNAKILILQSSPSFETKQLQNWAGKQDAQLMVKTQISKDKYITRSINLPKAQSTEVTPELLSYFDLVIVDGRALTQLSKLHYQWLKFAIKKGLGLLILVDNSLVDFHQKTPIEMLSGTAFQRLNQVPQVVPYWSDNKDSETAMTEDLLPGYPALLQVQNDLNKNGVPLVFSENGRVLTFKQDFGKGTVAVSLVRETYRWVTSGDKRAHSHFWQNLIEHISRRRSQSIIVPFDNREMNFSQNLTKLCVASGEQSAPIKKINVYHRNDASLTQQVLINQEVLINGERCGFFWPEKPGWFKASVNNSRTDSQAVEEIQDAWFYIEPQSSWLAFQQQERIRATLRKQMAFNEEKKELAYNIHKPINQWIFWWSFFIAASLIWLERKVA